MSVLLIAEHNNKEVRPFTLNAVTAASQIDTDVHAVVIGQSCDAASKALSELPLVKKVIQVEAAHYENFIAENFAPVIVKLAGNYTLLGCLVEGVESQYNDQYPMFPRCLRSHRFAIASRYSFYGSLLASNFALTI